MRTRTNCCDPRCLANVPMHQRGDLNRACSLLLEAREVLRLKGLLIPVDPKHDIAALCSQTKEASSDTTD